MLSRDCAASRRRSELLVFMDPVVMASSYMKLISPVRIVPTLLQSPSCELQNAFMPRADRKIFRFCWPGLGFRVSFALLPEDIGLKCDFQILVRILLSERLQDTHSAVA